MADLQSVQKIRDCLDVVEIVMGFLASGGQNSATSLEEYLTTALKMKHRFSSRKVSKSDFSRMRDEVRGKMYTIYIQALEYWQSRPCAITVGDTVCRTG